MKKTLPYRNALLCLGLWVLAQSQGALAGPLQSAIDGAQEFSVIELGPGLYEENLTITKPLIIKGASGAIIRGNGKNNVITVRSDNVTLENLTIENSGGEHQSIDSGIAVKGSRHVRLLDNTIRNCLFGINLEQTNYSLVKGNKISSKDLPLGLRGDGIRLWYSHGNQIFNNESRRVRDNVFWYSSGNTVEQNTGRDSRYSLHFMYADRNKVLNNDFQDNSVGIFLMFSKGSTVRDNLIANASGPFGIGVGMKDASDIIVEGNDILYNARGLYLDSSPYVPGTLNSFVRNKISFNTMGIQFHGTLYASRFENNTFEGNIEDVINDTPESRIDLNVWEKNRWDNYEGFDRNRDGIGDIPYESWVYADKVWQHRPAAKIFYASPVLEILNFLGRIMPFSEPELVAKDAHPRVREKESRRATH